MLISTSSTVSGKGKDIQKCDFHTKFHKNMSIKVSTNYKYSYPSVRLEDTWRNRGLQLHPLSNSALDGGAWSASRAGRFSPGYRATRVHYIGGWVGPRAGLDILGNREIPYPSWELKHHSSTVQHTTWSQQQMIHSCYNICMYNISIILP
jgi:hypothetical protein